MAGCCDVQVDKGSNKTVLITVLLINLLVFMVQFTAALIGRSTALLADSIDMLGDALSYSVSLYAVKKGGDWIAKAALFKGTIIAIFGCIVLIEALDKIFLSAAMPNVLIMLVFGVLGLLANGICFLLLSMKRDNDINMRSAWLCARNDLIGNVSVLIAAGLIVLFQSRWPDIIIGLGFVAILFFSAFKVIKSARQQLK